MNVAFHLLSRGTQTFARHLYRHASLSIRQWVVEIEKGRKVIKNFKVENIKFPFLCMLKLRLKKSLTVMFLFLSNFRHKIKKINLIIYRMEETRIFLIFCHQLMLKGETAFVLSLFSILVTAQITVLTVCKSFFFRRVSFGLFEISESYDYDALVLD